MRLREAFPSSSFLALDRRTNNKRKTFIKESFPSLFIVEYVITNVLMPTTIVIDMIRRELWKKSRYQTFQSVQFGVHSMFCFLFFNKAF